MRTRGMAMKSDILAVTVVLASTIALVCVTGSSVASVSVNEHHRQPGPPFIIWGFVYEADGVTPVTDCPVNVTHENTGLWYLTSTDSVYGYYEISKQRFDVNNGDVFNVTATKGSQIGWNESVRVDLELQMWINVTVSPGEIPEFPSLIAPILGLTCLVVLVSVARGRKV